MNYVHLITTFIPSLCILTIAQATVYFKTEHFKTSVPVAVSALLGKSFSTQQILYLFPASVVHALHLGDKIDSYHIIHEGC